MTHEGETPPGQRGVSSSSRVGKVSAFAAFATQETVALVGLTALALDPNQTLTFEPWGCAAALLFTWLIVRSEVLVASEGLTAKARVAAIQTGTVAALALVWAAAELDADPRFAAEGFGRPSALVSAVAALPLGPLTYLGILQAAVGVLEPAAVNRSTRGHATLLAHARPHRRRRVAGPRRRRGRELGQRRREAQLGRGDRVRRHRAAGGPVPRAGVRGRSEKATRKWTFGGETLGAGSIPLGEYQ